MIQPEIGLGAGPGTAPDPERVFTELDRDGISVLGQLIPPDVLTSVQRAFGSRLQTLRWNHFDGYEKTEKFRHMVQDVLTLDQGFVDIALHPTVKEVLRRYIGEDFSLAEAKGWLSLPTKRDFHGWHGDAWYDQEQLQHIPREVKLAVYLSDVRTGAFHYIKRTHRQWHPRDYEGGEITDAMKENVVEITGPAGSAFLFDTSGIHRQGMPILEPRQAVFLNYHVRSTPIQAMSVRSYRYHPLMLNAAFLGDLSTEDMRILGFGNKSGFQPAYVPSGKKGTAFHVMRIVHAASIWANDLSQRVKGKLGLV